jgi:hypothetical protein
MTISINATEYSEKLQHTSLDLKKRKRKNQQARHWWLTPAILSTCKTEIRRITVQGQPGP